MQISRRGFISSLLLGGLSFNDSALRQAWAADAGSEITGYPLSLASGVPRAAWSALPGETIHFALSADAHKTRKLHLQSVGGEVVHDFGAIKFGAQQFMSDAPWQDGAGYAPTVSWTIPAHMPSGVYFLNGLPDLFVIVREPLSGAHTNSTTTHYLPTAVLVPTNTINAYSTTDGRSAYAHPHAVPLLNFQRPFNASIRQNWVGTLAWLNTESLFGAPRYVADSDLDDPRTLHGARLLIVIGHSEYWTRKAREVFDGFVREGGHVILASGNTMWWQVRYADHGQQMVCYKDDAAVFGTDPERDPLLVTRSWVSAALQYPIVDSIGGDFHHGGFGSRRAGQKVAGRGLQLVDPDHPLFANQRLGRCESLDFGGVDEYDGAPIKGLDAHGLPLASLIQAGSRSEILAYQWTRRGGATLATAHLYQPQLSSGVILHLSAPEASNGESAGCATMRRAALEFARRCLEEKPVFSERAAGEVEHVLHTPWPHPLPVIAGRCGPPRAAPV